MKGLDCWIKNKDKYIKGVVTTLNISPNTGTTFEGVMAQVFDMRPYPPNMEYNKVIFNNPATIVYWRDGTKTVVKCDEKDEYIPMLGLALCFMKKALGNKSRHLNDVLHAEGF